MTSIHILDEDLDLPSFKNLLFIMGIHFKRTISLHS